VATGDAAAPLALPPEALMAGAAWWVESWILSGHDAKDDRPVVIVQAERHQLGFVVVWTRTSDISQPGILTPPDVPPDLNKQGVISPRHQHQIEVSRLREPFARFLGVLPEPYRSRVISEWEGGL
jgi:mRNA-degrading endonuclease toxin of MazEF toxin-antitoxin module